VISCQRSFPGKDEITWERDCGNVNPIGRRSCYDEGKRCAETLFFDYRRQHNMPIKVVRIFNTYGPRMHPNDGRVVSNFIVQALRGHEITIYGEGNQTRSFCYVDDLIEAIARIMETPPDVTGPINIGNPHEFTIRELAELIIKLTTTKSKLRFEPLPSDDPRQRQPDISEARLTLKWEPKTQLREGLTKTIAYFDSVIQNDASTIGRASSLAYVYGLDYECKQVEVRRLHPMGR
jgi:UDP-glucuronate decarboxylase